MKNEYEEMLLTYLKELLQGEQVIEEKEEKLVIGMPMDNIIFMKHYFKSKGYDAESEDFITNVLKNQISETSLNLTSRKQVKDNNSYAYNLEDLK